MNFWGILGGFWGCLLYTSYCEIISKLVIIKEDKEMKKNYQFISNNYHVFTINSTHDDMYHSKEMEIFVHHM